MGEVRVVKVVVPARSAEVAVLAELVAARAQLAEWARAQLAGMVARVSAAVSARLAEGLGLAACGGPR